MANTGRGEVEINIRGRLLPMRVTHDAIVQMEQWAGVGLGELLARFTISPPQLNAQQVCAVVAAGLRAGAERRRPRPRAWGQLWLKRGTSAPL